MSAQIILFVCVRMSMTLTPKPTFVSIAVVNLAYPSATFIVGGILACTRTCVVRGTVASSPVPKTPPEDMSVCRSMRSCAKLIAELSVFLL